MLFQDMGGSEFVGERRGLFLNFLFPNWFGGLLVSVPASGSSGPSSSSMMQIF